MKILSRRLGNGRFLNSVILIILKWTVAVAGYILHSGDTDQNSINKTVQPPCCTNITTGKYHNVRMANDNYHSSTSNEMREDTIPTIESYINDYTNICNLLSPQLLHCNLREFARNEYRIENHTLFHGADLVAELGDYYVDRSGRAYACDQPIKANKMIPRCNYVPLNSDQYTIFPNGSFFIKPAQERVDCAVFNVDNQSSNANVCYPLEIQFLNCDSQHKRIVMPYDYRLHINRQIHYLSDDQWFQLGEYYFVNEQRDVALCVHYTVLFRVLRILLVVSSICLTLSFIYQWMEPRNTCYKKSFLVHNFTLAVVCCWYTYTRYQTGQPWLLSTTGKYIKFSIGYLSFKAAATWLTIAGYEIWRSFVSLNDCHRLPQGRKRFVYYSIAGWGIPIVLFTIVLTVNFSGTLQDYLSLHPDIELSGWLHEPRSGFAFHYGPMQILYCLNGFFFLCTLYQIRKVGEDIETVNNQRHRQLLRLSFKLSLVMGIFWIIECLLWMMRWFTTFPFKYISDGILGLQGMVFLGLTAFKKETPGLLSEKIRIVQSKVKVTVDRIKNFC